MLYVCLIGCIFFDLEIAFGWVGNPFVSLAAATSLYTREAVKEERLDGLKFMVFAWDYAGKLLPSRLRRAITFTQSRIQHLVH